MHHLCTFCSLKVRKFSGGSRISRGGGANSPGGGANIRNCQIFRKHCMKSKEFGPPGGGARPSRPPLDSANGNQWRIQDFPEDQAPTPQGGAPTYEIAKFSEKLHEIERIWTPRGGRASLAPPLRSANGNNYNITLSLLMNITMNQLGGASVIAKFHS